MACGSVGAATSVKAAVTSLAAPGRITTLGAAWLAAHGQGRVQGDQREQLQALLLQDLASKPGAEGAKMAAIQEEVGRFLDSGRVSEANFDRLERRVQARLASGSLSSRGSRRSTASASSQNTPSGGALSARGPSRGGAGLEAHALLAARCQPLPQVPEEKGGVISTWSEVAKYSKELEALEQVQRREALRSSQQLMRQYLAMQVEEKKQQKLRAAEEEHRLLEHQEAELERWRSAQNIQLEEAKRRELEVKRDRELQCSLVSLRRDQEKKQKLLEDQILVQKAARELEEEQRHLQERKLETKQLQSALVEEWQKGRQHREEQKRLRMEEEKQKIKEYGEMLERQEARNKQSLGVAREPRGANVTLHRRGRRGEDVYTEESLMKQHEEANRRRDEEDQQKQEHLKLERLKNQDFLFKQIAERDRLRRQAREMKGSQKQAAQAATAEFLEAERRRTEEQRMKNIQYRLELEKQIQAKRSSTAPRQTEDVMSAAEKAINRQLLAEAQHLREQGLLTLSDSSQASAVNH